MTLVRLYRYLNHININIKPNEDFVSKDGGEYVSRCKNFHNDAMSNLAAEATKGVDFMLLDIWDNGAKKCQILESPGEKLFEPDPNKKIPFPVQYVSNIIDSDNRKVYIFILEPNYKDDATRVRYKDRIAEVKQMMDKKDKVIFLSGIENNISLGTPIAFVIENKNVRKQDYDNLKTTFRPSHADYTYFCKYGINASSGGGRASARETVCRVVGGSLAKQFLSSYSIYNSFNSLFTYITIRIFFIVT